MILEFTAWVTDLQRKETESSKDVAKIEKKLEAFHKAIADKNLAAAYLVLPQLRAIFYSLFQQYDSLGPPFSLARLQHFSPPV